MSSLIPDLRRGGAEASNHSVGADRAPPARPTARGTVRNSLSSKHYTIMHTPGTNPV